MPEQNELILSSGEQLLQPTTRRRFLGLLGVSGAIVMLPSFFTACEDTTDLSRPGTGGRAVTLDFSSDAGVLNYAFVLEQLEAGFYTTALTSPGFAALSAGEQEVLSDLQKHEVIHREFLRRALDRNAVPDISFNLQTVSGMQASRDALLRTSQLLEDTGVSAYNGAGKYLTNAANLLVAGKIVSVEARHAAAIRDIRDGNGGRLFAGDDVVNQQGLDVKAEPSTVLGAVGGLNVLSSSVAIGTQPDQSKKTADFPAPNPT